MRFDVVCIYTYITITQYVSKDKNQKSEFFVSFFRLYFLLFIAYNTTFANENLSGRMKTRYNSQLKTIFPRQDKEPDLRARCKKTQTKRKI